MICSLCPRACHALRTPDEGRGFCGLPSTMRIARIAPHLWEEPPVSGTRGTGAVFFSGCTLRCRFCQNAPISHRNEGKAMTCRELADSLRRLVDMGVHTISFITAAPYVEAILETLGLYRPPVPLVYNTSGYESPETLRRLEPFMDVYLPDLKHFSPSLARLCTGREDYFPVASEAILEMVRQKGDPVLDEQGILRRGVLIRHLILPGCTSDSLAVLRWIADHVPSVPVSLMQQYTPMNQVDIPGFQRSITRREYDRVRQGMLTLGLKGFYQGPTASDESFVPLFNQPESFV